MRKHDIKRRNVTYHLDRQQRKERDEGSRSEGRKKRGKDTAKRKPVKIKRTGR